MSEDLVPRNFFVHPGFVCLPASPTYLCAVVSSGVAVTLFDARRKFGGMSHYTEPRRRDGLSTPRFAAPSLVSLIRMMLEAGSTIEDLDARLYGGAENRMSPFYVPGLSEQNIITGEELLARHAITISAKDVGGTKGRKIVFHTGTGETVVAHVDRLRASDWYPVI